MLKNYGVPSSDFTDLSAYLKSFSVENGMEGPQASIAWEFAGAIDAIKIIKKEGAYPTSIYDGIEVWSGSSTWTEVAPQPDTEFYIYSLVVFNGKLYGGTYPNGSLVEWNGVDAWVEVAPQHDAEVGIYSLVVFNGKLYGSTSGHGKLVEWNGVDAWVERAPQIGAETRIYSLAVFNGKLYGGTYPNGSLVEWNGVDAWVEVAPQIGAETTIWVLAVFNGKLYGGTASNGSLVEWNGVDAWVERAPQHDAEIGILSLVVSDGKLYGGTTPNGSLVEWNGVDAWVEVASQLDPEDHIYSLAVFNGKLYGGTGLHAKLHEWNVAASGTTFTDLNLNHATMYYFTLFLQINSSAVWVFDQICMQKLLTYQTGYYQEKLWNSVSELYRINDEITKLLVASEEEIDSAKEWVNLGENGIVPKGQLQRLLKLISFPLDEIKGKIDAIVTMIDVDKTDADILPLMAAFVGLDFNYDVPIQTQREEIKAAIPGYRIKGTIPAIEHFCRAISLLDVTIVEFIRLILTSNDSTKLSASITTPGEMDNQGIPGDNAIYSLDFSSLGNYRFDKFGIYFSIGESGGFSRQIIEKIVRLIANYIPASTIGKIIFSDFIYEGTSLGAYPGTIYHAFGTGDPVWDGQVVPPAGGESTLENEIYRRIPDGVTYLNGSGYATDSVTNKIRVITTLEDPESSVDENYIREQGLFGGAATEQKDSGTLLTLHRHAGQWKNAGWRLRKTIELNI